MHSIIKMVDTYLDLLADTIAGVAVSSGSLLKSGVSRRERSLGQHHERVVSSVLEDVFGVFALVVESDTLLSLDGGRSQDSQGSDGGSDECDFVE